MASKAAASISNVFFTLNSLLKWGFQRDNVPLSGGLIRSGELLTFMKRGTE